MENWTRLKFCLQSGKHHLDKWPSRKRITFPAKFTLFVPVLPELFMFGPEFCPRSCFLNALRFKPRMTKNKIPSQLSFSSITLLAAHCRNSVYP